MLDDLELDAHSYQLRHSGAAAHLVSKRRTLAQTREIGRWKTDSSLRRYGKANLIKKALDRLPLAHQHLGEWNLQHLEALLNRRAVPRLPVKSGRRVNVVQ